MTTARSASGLATFLPIILLTKEKRMLAPSGKVLDIGCGIGLGTKMLAEKAHAYGVDLTRKMMNARKNAPDAHQGICV